MRRAVFCLFCAFTIASVGCSDSAKTSDPKSAPGGNSDKLTPASMDSGGKPGKAAEVGGAKSQKMAPGGGAP